MKSLGKGAKIIRLDYQHLNEEHVEQALEIVLAGYREERQAVPCLPAEESIVDNLWEMISSLFARSSGLAAVKDGKLLGFISGVEREQLFGKDKGIYCPLYGHGAVKTNRAEIYQDMYTQAAQMWVEKDLYSHVLTLYAHDRQTIDTWFWLGFGLRCVDAIRSTEAIEAKSHSVVIRKGEGQDIAALRDIMTDFAMFWPGSPTFMPNGTEDVIQNYTQWFQKTNRHFWVAYLEGKAVGQIRIQPGAETFVSEHPGVMNITSAFVGKKYRTGGIGLMLLAEVQRWLKQNGYYLCGVDFESFNVPGSRFWNRYFTPYTYSVVRRIDERIGSSSD